MPEEKKYAEVIVNKAIRAVDRPFHYRVPQGLQKQIQLGSLVQIPFGRQRLEGVVVGFLAQPEVQETKEILKLLLAQPILNQEMIGLAYWLAEYYLCPKVSALQAMLPAGVKLSGRAIGAKTMDCAFLTPGTAEDEPAGDKGTGINKGKLGPKQRAILAYLQTHNGVEVVKVLADTNASRSSLKSLADRGLVRIERQEIYRDPYGEMIFPEKPPKKLTKEQEEALNSIQKEGAAAKRPVLLFGVTGSGKTEIYLRLIEKALDAGQEAIVLVPEIALTPQMVAIFKSRLGARVAVLHSGLSMGERRDAWQQIAQGHIPVVVGARSAVFAPCPNLGLIIMDEEHEQSYKQESVPRFHAREVAKERARRQKALLVMGTATPSLETYHQSQMGKYHLVTLSKRINQRPLPPVHIVDMRGELRGGNKSIFSRLLKEKLQERLERKEQSLLFLNRRGYHTFVSCRNCGLVLQCPHCNISLTTHGKNHRLDCHYCGYSTRVAKLCPQCGSGAIRHFGSGTERLAAEVQKLFPAARIARADGDTTAKKGAYDQIYFAVKRGEIDVLVGTQMIAKGLDFPRVTLVGIISADAALYLPEMRAGERAFQLITQVSGRAGRDKLMGEVVMQTYRPEDSILIAAAKQDYQAFYQGEIAQRHLGGYPPFRALIRILFTGEKFNFLMEESRIITRFVQAEMLATNEILGPAPAPLDKIKDRFRVQVIIKTNDLNKTRQDLTKALEKARQDGFPHKNIILNIDVEPLNMM